MANATLTEQEIQTVLDRLSGPNRKEAEIYPGTSPERQPVHTVYGGAHLFKSDGARKLGELAVRSLDDYAPNFAIFARALGLPGSEMVPDSMAAADRLARLFEKDPLAVQDSNRGAHLALTVYDRVRKKLQREALEDFRIDFEDGYGNRPDAEEDKQAEIAAKETALGMKNGTLSPFIGIRIKPFTEELKARGVRTLNIYLSTLAQETGGKLPANFVVTLPKVTQPEQVSALVDLFELLEGRCGFGKGALRLEIMIETTQSVFSHQGFSYIPLMAAAARGRCRGAHFGTYDYTASCDIIAAHQAMDHPACDFARSVMKTTLGSTGIMLSDGATNVMPVGPHRAKEGEKLAPAQIVENTQVVHRAWKLAYDHVRHSLFNAFYQGWDLHPAQFPVRYAAVYSFFLEQLEQSTVRLRTFIEKAAQATLVGDVFDDAATGQGLLNYFLRALNCGAVTDEEIRATGLTLEEIRGRSFVKILKARRT